MRALALCVAVSLCGCGEGLTPEYGQPLTVAEACSAVEAEPVDWTDVAPVLEKRCGCHVIPGGVGQTVGGLDLSSYEGALRGGARSDAVVVPGDPCASDLVLKIVDPPFGAAMPLDGTRLPTEELDLLIAWIDQGAQP